MVLRVLQTQDEEPDCICGEVVPLSWLLPAMKAAEALRVARPGAKGQRVRAVPCGRRGPGRQAGMDGSDSRALVTVPKSMTKTR